MKRAACYNVTACGSPTVLKRGRPFAARMTTAIKAMAIAVLFFLFSQCITNPIKEKRDKKNMLYLVKYENTNQNRMKLIFVWKPDKEEENGGCEVFDDQNLIAEVLSSSSWDDILNRTEAEVKDILEECTEVKVRKKRQAFRVSASSNFNFRTNVYQNGFSSGPTYGRDYSSNARLWNGGSSSSMNARRYGSRPASNSHQQFNKTSAGSTTASMRNTTDSSITASTTEDSGFDIIFPGTKWCGAGDVAKSYEDLGQYNDTDMCCRAHDNCNDTMKAGETRYNLTNKSPFTALSCRCDNEFYDCLAKVNSIISNKIGGIYFNILRRECYTYDYPPASTCKDYRSFLKISCKEYEKNTTAPKVYQWEKPKLYRQLPLPGGLTLPNLR